MPEGGTLPAGGHCPGALGGTGLGLAQIYNLFRPLAQLYKLASHHPSSSPPVAPAWIQPQRKTDQLRVVPGG